MSKPFNNPVSCSSGSTLVVALLLLTTMTILGIATMDTTRLGERIASNMQQKATAFDASESAIVEGLDPANLLGVMSHWPEAGVSDFARYSPANVGASLSESLDQTTSDGNTKTIDLHVELVVAYCGENGSYTGSSLDADLSSPTLAGHIFDVHGISEIERSRARAAHVQRTLMIRPRVNRTDVCPSP